MNKNKVALFINTLSGGGAEGVCVNLANGLAGRGMTVDLVVLNLKKDDYLKRITSDVNLVNLQVNHSRYALWSIRRYIISNDIRIALSFNFEISVLLVLARNIFKLNINIIGRNIIAFSQRKKNSKGIWRKYFASKLIDVFFVKVDHVVNQCRFMEKDLVAVYPVLKGRTSVIYNPAMLIDKKIEGVGKEPYVLCVGRLEPQKAFDIAVKSFSVFYKKNPNYKLLIVGRGSLELSLKQLVQSLGISNAVFFLGFKTELAELYHGAKCTLLTSRFEGFPNVLLESIAMGTPVVSIDCPSGPNEIVINDVNGILFKTYEPNEIAKHLTSVCNKSWDDRVVRESIDGFKLDNVLSQYQLLFNRMSNP